MPRFLSVLWLSLLLVCCDKPESPDVSKDTEARVGRGGHKPRERTPDAPESPRGIMETEDEIASPAVREKALADIAWNAIEIDPPRAHEAFQQLPADSPERIRLIQHYAMRLAEQNPEEAHAWAATLGSEQEISVAISQIALALAETDPLHAANLLSESGIAGREFDVAVVQVLQRWAAKSVPDAAAWVSSFPQGAVREAGIKIISEQWLPRDAAAAFDWLGTLPDQQLRKEALRAMEGVILQQPQDVRDRWLQHADARIQIELEQQRGEAIKDVGDNLPAPAK